MARRTVKIQTAYPDEKLGILRELLVRELKAAGASEVVVNESSLTFKGPADPFVPRETLLLPIDRGRVATRSSGDGILLEYDIRFTRFVLTTTAIIVAALTALVLLAHFPIPGAVVLGLLWVVGIVCGNVLIGSWRFRRLMRKALEKATDSQVGVRGAGPGLKPYR